jgi:WD40 repeat protein
MALSPNGTMLASGSQDGKVRLWDIDTRKVIEKWTGHTNHVLSVCWSGDGKRVLSGSSDGTARILDAKSGKTVLNIKTGHERVYAVIYSPNQTKIATGGDKEDAVKIWDAKTGKLLTTLKHDNIVLSLAWDIKQKEALGPVRQPLVSFVWVRFVLKRTDVEVKRMLPRVSHTVTHVDNQ